MSPPTPEDRAAVARDRAAEIAETILREGVRTDAVWYRGFVDIRDILGDPSGTAQERLDAAAQRFDQLYQGPRNFSDFYLERSTPDERAAENEKFSAKVNDLERLLRGTGTVE